MAPRQRRALDRPLALRVSGDMYAELERLADKESQERGEYVSVASVARRLIADGLATHKNAD